MDHNYKSSDIEFPMQKIELRDMRKEVETSFIEYSMKEVFTSFSISLSSIFCWGNSISVLL